MAACVGIRREDKSEWERRVPLIPEDVKILNNASDIEFVVQPSPIRAFPDREYEKAGARLSEDLSDCSIVFAVKEIPIKLLQPGVTYIFFSHVIKGQPYNMPLLRKLMELGCNLIDYEKVTDEKGRRLIFFGRHAGLAGAVDTLHALGLRFKHEGLDTPFLGIKSAHEYRDLADIRDSLGKVGEDVSKNGLPEAITPVVVGITGYGNVGGGAREIIEMLPHREIQATGLKVLLENSNADRNVIYLVVFKEQDSVEPVSSGLEFSLQDFFENPGNYKSKFYNYTPYLTLLINAIYWQAGNPRLVTKDDLHSIFSQEEKPRLRVIGDISCDIEGGIEVTVKSTQPGNPCYTYNPADSNVQDGCEGEGVVIMAVDNLPCELPSESSADFSRILKDYVTPIARADFTAELDKIGLPPELKRALILHRGKLTPDYEYLREFVEKK